MASQDNAQAIFRTNMRPGNMHAALPSGKVKGLPDPVSTSFGRACEMQDNGWLRAIRRYLGTTVLANLVWEFAQMPLYTVWQAPWAEIAFAGLHCLGGDLLIASASILAALIVLKAERWPESCFRRVAAATMSFGPGYTAFSEWLNVSVRQSWA